MCQYLRLGLQQWIDKIEKNSTNKCVDNEFHCEQINVLTTNFIVNSVWHAIIESLAVSWSCLLHMQTKLNASRCRCYSVRRRITLKKHRKQDETFRSSEKQDVSTHDTSDFKVHSPARPLIRCSEFRPQSKNSIQFPQSSLLTQSVSTKLQGTESKSQHQKLIGHKRKTDHK